MHAVTMIQTQDGKLHKTVDEAKRHAEKVYGLELTRLAHEAIRTERYTAMCEFLEANLDAFARLRSLRDDCKVPGQSED